jgi:hypothetical protein
MCLLFSSENFETFFMHLRIMILMEYQYMGQLAYLHGLYYRICVMLRLKLGFQLVKLVGCQ